MRTVARDRADKREQDHWIEHARPAVRVGDPADERTLHERAYRAEAVDEADDSRGGIAAVHFAELSRKRSAQDDVRAAVEEADYHHDDRVRHDAHFGRGEEHDESECAQECLDCRAEQRFVMEYSFYRQTTLIINPPKQSV